MKSTFVLASLAFVASTAFMASTAQADVYNFSYVRLSGGQILSGQLDGILQADNNTVAVTSILGAPSLDGAPGLGCHSFGLLIL